MKQFSIILGKGIQKISKLRGGGSALPGLVIEKTDKNFLKNILGKLPYGVVVISGTNGKTTTTKIVSELLQKQNLKVFTNKSGSNFVRGVISAVLEKISVSGKFDYDVAVLELDEAHAVKFCETIPVDYSLVLNIQRDQLDRFGEIDHTAELLNKLTSVTKKCVILNREDKRVSKLEAQNRVFFGLSKKLLADFPNDDHLLNAADSTENATKIKANVLLENLKEQQATYTIDGKKYECNLTLKGVYNAYNAAGALTLCQQILPEVKTEKFIQNLSHIESAFGRGEVFNFEGKQVELLLVKNPSAFQLSLTSFADEKHDFMIAINDNIADGRDVSWLWNVDFSKLHEVTSVSGIRATDMALRLKYDNIPVQLINEDLTTAVKQFVSRGDAPKRIFATYTAMLEIRRIISGKSLI